MLVELRQHDPAAKLADAQSKLARDYGFSSWRTLKARSIRCSPRNPRRSDFALHGLELA